MKRLSVLLVVGLVIAALAAVRLWPRAGSEQAGALPQITLHPRDVRGVPVLWLGDNYDANHDGKPNMQLTGAELHDSPEFRDPRNGALIKPETKWYSMGYGSCVLPTPMPGNEQFGCSIPTINFYSVCGTPPLSNKATLARVRIRGVDAYEIEAGHLWVETATFTVSIQAWGKTLDEGRAHARQMVEDLIGANPEAAAFTTGAAFTQQTDAAARLPCAQLTSATAATPAPAPTATAAAAEIHLTGGPAVSAPGGSSGNTFTVEVTGVTSLKGYSVVAEYDASVISITTVVSVPRSNICAANTTTDGGGLHRAYPARFAFESTCASTAATGWPSGTVGLVQVTFTCLRAGVSTEISFDSAPGYTAAVVSSAAPDPATHLNGVVRCA